MVRRRAADGTTLAATWRARVPVSLFGTAPVAAADLLPPVPQLPRGCLEWQHQAAVMSWAAEGVRVLPELVALYGTANGGERPARVNARGQRYSLAGQRLAVTGVADGIPDLDWPVRRGQYSGLHIEMKRPEAKGATSASQDRWIEVLRALGRRAEVADSATIACRIIADYWRLGPPRE